MSSVYDVKGLGLKARNYMPGVRGLGLRVNGKGLGIKG